MKKKKNNYTFSPRTININTLIPMKKMYVYKGTLPFDTCNGEHDIIVFSKNDGVYIEISTDNYNLLKGIITRHIILTRKNSFYVNNKGPKNSLADISGDIYIDCKPVSEDDEKEGPNIIGGDDKKNKNIFKDLFGGINFKNGKNTALIMGLLVVIFCFFMMYILIRLNFKRMADM